LFYYIRQYSCLAIQEYSKIRKRPRKTTKGNFRYGEPYPDFLGTTYQDEKKYTKSLQNIQKGQKYIPHGCKTFQRALKYTNIVIPKALQNMVNLVFLVWKYFIRQPWCKQTLWFQGIKQITYHLVRQNFIKCAQYQRSYYFKEQRTKLKIIQTQIQKCWIGCLLLFVLRLW
jgi:hypothetical protein